MNPQHHASRVEVNLNGRPAKEDRVISDEDPQHDETYKDDDGADKSAPCALLTAGNDVVRVV